MTRAGTPAPTRQTHSVWVPRLLALLITLTLGGLGLLAIVSEHYHGSSSKLRGPSVDLAGRPAIAMGLSLVFLGLMPLALWFRQRRPALIWALACVAAAAVAFGVAWRGGPG